MILTVRVRFLMLLDQVDDVVEARVGLFKALIMIKLVLTFEAEVTRCLDCVTGQRSLGHWRCLILACAR